MGDYLACGVCSDEDMLKTKGPTIMNVKERSEIIRHCKFIQHIVEDVPYTPTLESVDKLGCTYYAHGDDPCIDSEGVDVCQVFRENDRFKLFKRTEGVSTTEITGRILALAEYNILKESDPEKAKAFLEAKVKEAPKQKFLATTRRIINFANQNNPTEKDTIGYIQGSFDLLHQGHCKRLEEAKKQCDFLYVGLWDDDMTRYYKGGMLPILSVQERLLMLLSSKHVDDVIIGAPFVITEDLLKSLNISKVFQVVNTKEDTVLEEFSTIDQYAVPRQKSMVIDISIDDEFYNLTTELLAMRVFENRAAFELKFTKKQKSSQEYYNSSKQFVQEV